MGFESFNDRQNLVIQGLAYLNCDGFEGKTIKQILFEYKPKKEEQEQLKTLRSLVDNDPALKELKVAHVGNNNIGANGSDSGLYAIALEDDKGNMAFSYRGTEDLNAFELSSDNIDQLDNYVAMFLPTTKQNIDALKFFDKYKGEKGNYLYGHSKGGNLSQEVLVNRPDDVTKAHVINPYPINYFKLTHKQQNILFSEKMNIVIIGGDIVSFLGFMPYQKRIRYIHCRGGFTDFF